MLLIIFALYALGNGWFARKRSVVPGLGVWAMICSVSAALWLLAYAGIWYGGTDLPLLLWSGRLAFAGPMIGHPATFFMLRVLATGEKPDRRLIAGVFGAALLTHLPAFTGPSVIASVQMDNGAAVWSYGPLQAVPMLFHGLLLIYETVWLVRRWSGIDWSSRNRVLIDVTAFFVTMQVQLTLNQVLPVLFGDNRYLFVGPGLTIIPITVLTWSIVDNRLPDLFGAIGKVFPNPRSRLLDELALLESRMSPSHSVEYLVRRLSDLAGAPVTLAWEAAGVQAGGAPAGGERTGGAGTARFRVALPPESSARLYGAGDLGRVQRIVDRLGITQTSQTGALALRMTGWNAESRILEPKGAVWPAVSQNALSVSDAVVRALSSGPGLVLISRDAPRELLRSAARIAGRPHLVEAIYPYPESDDGPAGRGLLEQVTDPQGTVIWVWTETDTVRPEFEFALGALLHDGAKAVVCSSSLHRRAFGRGRLLGSREFGGPELPVMETDDPVAFPDGVSLLIDQYLVELGMLYGRDFQVSPEERDRFCRRDWRGSSEQLRGEIERFVLEKSGLPPAPAA